MSKYFDLGLAALDNGQLISMSSKLRGKLGGSSYYSGIDTSAEETAENVLQKADDNKGTGTGSTTTAKSKRNDLLYQVNSNVKLVEILISDPSIIETVRDLMIDATDLPKKKDDTRGKQIFEYEQKSATEPAYLLAQGIKNGKGLHQWKTTTDIDTFKGYTLLDPTENAKIELDGFASKTEYAAMHRTCLKGVWSDWEGPITFMTL